MINQLQYVRYQVLIFLVVMLGTSMVIKLKFALKQ